MCMMGENDRNIQPFQVVSVPKDILRVCVCVRVTFRWTTYFPHFPLTQFHIQTHLQTCPIRTHTHTHKTSKNPMRIYWLLNNSFSHMQTHYIKQMATTKTLYFLPTNCYYFAKNSINNPTYLSMPRVNKIMLRLKTIGEHGPQSDGRVRCRWGLSM